MPSINNPSDGIGDALIGALAKHGLTGTFFDYASYTRLRGINKREELRIFLIDHGFTDVDALQSAAQIAEAIAESHNRRQLHDLSFWASVEPSGCLAIIWLPYMIVKYLLRFFR